MRKFISLFISIVLKFKLKQLLNRLQLDKAIKTAIQNVAALFGGNSLGITFLFLQFYISGWVWNEQMFKNIDVFNGLNEFNCLS